MKRKAEYLAELRANNRDLITIQEVAGFFGVCTRTVWAWIARGDFPPPKHIGPRCRRWSVAELQEWIDDGCPRMEACR